MATRKTDNHHTIQFVAIKPGDTIDWPHNGTKKDIAPHLLGVIPGKGRNVNAYAIFAAHDNCTVKHVRPRK